MELDCQICNISEQLKSDSPFVVFKALLKGRIDRSDGLDAHGLDKFASSQNPALPDLLTFIFDEVFDQGLDYLVDLVLGHIRDHGAEDDSRMD